MGSQEPMPIAIVGIGCRLPGDVSTLTDLYQLLSRKRSTWCEVPKDRFNAAAYQHPSPDKRGCFNSQGGYFLNTDITMFDAGFFDITKKEAESMDPAMRLLLECVYEALENGGFPKQTISGTKMGVYVGANYSEHRMSNLRDVDHTPTYDATGNQSAFLAGRVAYYYNLRGPALAVDTACSSSMHALHLAVQSIRAGESDSAIVAAAHLITDPDIWVSMGKLRLFSDTGKTHAFDHRAKSGYARGEGAGCVILKPLDRAQADRDHIYAVLTHTGINHNGRTVGIVAPSEEEQEQLLKRVFREAKIDPRDIGFFEAHGTGTKKGDPIEAKAIYKAVSRNFAQSEPLYIGSVKQNIGHLECASGIVSVIKAALALSSRFVFPNADFEHANENIPLHKWRLKVLGNHRPWPLGRKYVCVNNFGFSGSNGTAVLSAAPSIQGMEAESVVGDSRPTHPRLYVLSAADETALRNTVSQFSIWIERHVELYQTTLPHNLAYTLCERRSHLPWRVAVVAEMTGEIANVLNRGETAMARAPSEPPKLAFVYTGQGAQWFAMGRGLLRSHPVFYNAIRRAEDTLRHISSFSILHELEADEEHSKVGLAHVSQPICTAVQLALTDLLASFGIRPSAVTGHSSGEIAAAYAAGALDFESAMEASFYRGRMIEELKEKHPSARGSMMAVGAGAAQLEPVLAAVEGGVAVVACENSPASTTVSGDEVAIDRLVDTLKEKGIFCRKLFVDVAYHSPHMQLIAESYIASVSHIQLRAHADSSSPVEFFSSLYGRSISLSELGPQYWVDNLTNRVRFTTALKCLCTEAKPDVLIEVGPHAALKGPIAQILQSVGSAATKIKYLPTLVRNQDATHSCLETAGQLFVRGYPLNFHEINHHHEKADEPRLVPSPFTYPWTRQRYWHESRLSRQHRHKPFARHDLLGTLADWSSDLEPTWRNVLAPADLPWLKEYRVHSRTVFPLSGFLCMIIEAAKQQAAMKGKPAAQFDIRNLEVTEHLLLDDGHEVEILLNFRPASRHNDSNYAFRITSHVDGRGWMKHCTGTLLVEAEAVPSPQDVVEEVEREAAATSPGGSPLSDSSTESTDEPTPPDSLDMALTKGMPLSVTRTSVYNRLGMAGMSYPPLFHSFVSVCVADRRAKGLVGIREAPQDLPPRLQGSNELHPAVVEAMLQLPIFGFLLDEKDKSKVAYLPSSIRHMTVRSRVDGPALGSENMELVAMPERDDGDFLVEMGVDPNDATSAAVAISGVRYTPIEPEREETAPPRELCFGLKWEPLNEAGPEGIDAPARQNPSQDVVLITHGTPQAEDPLVVALSRHLGKETGVAPRVCQLREVSNRSSYFIVLSELTQPLLSTVGEAEFYRVKSLLTQAAGLLWVTKGATRFVTTPEAGMALGLLRTARSERGAVAASLDLDPESKLEATAQAALIWKAFATTALPADGETPEMEFSEEDGELVVPKIVPDEEASAEVHRALHPSAPFPQDFHQPERVLRLAAQGVAFSGTYEELFFEDVADTPLPDDEVEISVAASALTVDDVTPGATRVTRCCTGIITRTGEHIRRAFSVGQRVSALAEGRLGSSVRVKFGSFVRIPDSFTHQNATAVIEAVAPAIYALINIAKIQEKENVLIDVSGPPSIRAIQVASALGAKVYALIRNREQYEAARQAGLPSHRILDARSPSLRHQVDAVTQGARMQVVFTLSGQPSAAAAGCLADFGRFVEARQPSHHGTRIELRSVSASFTSFEMLSAAAAMPKIMYMVLVAAVQNVRYGIVKPPPFTKVVPVSELSDGLRMAREGGVESVVISTPVTEKVKAMYRAPGDIFRSDGTHIIIGGTGGLGKSVAKYMMKHGARHLVLLSRSGTSNGVVSELQQDIERHRAKVSVMKCDTSDIGQLCQLVDDVRAHLPRICGVVHAAMVLRDGLLENMTFGDWQQVIRAKVQSAWNMHLALARRHVELEYFVAFSSAAGIIGSRGQGAYAAANAFLDSFVQFRVRKGLPASSLDLTAVTGAGYLAENAERQEDVFRNFGNETISEEEVLALLSAAVRGVGGPQYLTGLKLNAGAGGRLPYYAKDRRFDTLRAACAESAAQEGGGAKPAVSPGRAFQAARSDEDAGVAAAQGLVNKFAEVLGNAPTDIDVDKDVTAYGMDSLTAIDVRNWISNEFRVPLEIMEVLSSGSVLDLAALIVEKARRK